MTHKLPTIFALSIAASLLAGCGSSGKTLTTTNTKDVASTKVAHSIKPDEVAAYVAEHLENYNDMSLTFDGIDYKVSIMKIDGDNSQVYVYLDSKNPAVDKTNSHNGYATFGFNFDTFKPVNKLKICFGTVTATTNNADVCYSAQKSMKMTTEIFGTQYDGLVSKDTSDGVYEVTASINDSLITHGTLNITLDDSNKAILSGELGTGSYIAIKEMIDNNPKVDTLVLKNMPGSLNDDINMHTGRLVRNAGLATTIAADGVAASGAVDLFAAGLTRTVEKGGKVGVHSWCCVKGKPANKLAKSDEAHAPLLTYSREMLGRTYGPDFYFFTLNAANFDNVHWMTTEQLNKYQLVTK